MLDISIKTIYIKTTGELYLIIKFWGTGSAHSSMPHNEFILFAEKYGYSATFDGLEISC